MKKIISNYKNRDIALEHTMFTQPFNSVYDFHIHINCEFIFVKSGSLSAIIGDNIYRVSKNNLIIFRANVPHKIIIDQGCDYERYDMLFDENKLGGGVFFRLPESLCYVNCSGNEQIISLFEKMDYFCKNFSDNDLGILLTNVIEEILFILSISLAEEYDEELISIHPILGTAIKYISSHYTEDISIDTLCEHLYITKGHLHHLFREHLQISPKKYINMRRLAKARKMIRMGERPNKIYSACGFSDYASFFRNYVAYFGYAPSKENEIKDDMIIESQF